MTFLIKASKFLINFYNIPFRSDHETAWAPILWAINLLQKEKATGRFQIEPPVYASLISSFEYIETSNRRIFDHGWVNFPLGISQLRVHFTQMAFDPQYILRTPTFHLRLSIGVYGKIIL